MRTIGRWHVEEEIGRGAHGVVFRARGPAGELVALKLLRRTADRDARLRFEHEQRLLATIGSERGFVPLLEAGEHAGAPYLVLPFVPGGTLRDRLNRGPLPVVEAVGIVRRLATALAIAHERGIVHRDLKPENVLFAADGTPLVADLGFAKHFCRDVPGATQSGALTDPGWFVGTPRYAAPEQLRDATAAGPGADVFALGAILRECLTGEVPAWVDAVVARALAPDLEDRYPDAAALAADLAGLRASAAPTDTETEKVSGGPPPRRPSPERRTSPAARIVRAGGLDVTLGRELGRGAMGAVFEGTASDGRRVAVKLVQKPGNSTRLRRFARERMVLAVLDHPNVVGFIAGSEGPPPCLVMELVEGTTLADLLEDEGGKLPPWRAAELVGDAAAGIAHAHEHGLVHRDLKPANVLVRARDGRAVVTDFGLAKDLDATSLTDPGAQVGTFLYMAPEQLEGEAGRASDVWALGLCLYQSLTGVHPFARCGNVGELALAVSTGRIAPLARIAPGLPPDLVSVVEACLVVDPRARIAAAELARRLRTRERAPRRARGAIAAAVVAVATLGVGLLAAGSRAPADAAAVYVFGAGPAPVLVPRALWANEETARPIEVPRPEAFTGSLVVRGKRAEVTYDLARTGRARSLDPARHFAAGRAGTLDPVRPGGTFVLAASSGAGLYEVAVGSSRWLDARAAFRIVALRPGDDSALLLGAGGATLLLHGRSATAQASGKPPRTGFRAESVVGRSLALFPSAPRGQRLVLPGDAPPWVASVDTDLAPSEEPAATTIRASEVEAALEPTVVVEGVPARGDVPARAIVPVAVPPRARIVAAFDVVPGSRSSGGAFVSLGDPASDPVLELDEARLVLRCGTRLLDERALGAPPSGGRLVLERRGERLVGLFEDGGRREALVAVDPLEEPAARGAQWGSTAPTVRFATVRVEALGSRELEGGLREPSSAAAARWRAAARTLALVTDPARGEAATVGSAARGRRAALAASACDGLRASASELADAWGGAARADALARAVLASIVAGDPDGASGRADELVALVGAAAARSLVDALDRDGLGRPALLERLAMGYDASDRAVVLAATLAASALAPELGGRIFAARADSLARAVEAAVRARGGSLLANERQELEATLRGAPPAAGLARADELALVVATARVRFLLGDDAGVLADARRGVELGSRATDLLEVEALALARQGRVEEALVPRLVLVAREPGGARARRALAADVALAIERDRASARAVLASAVLVLATLGDAGARAHARELASRVDGLAESEETDLGSYVLACTVGVVGGSPPVGARPTAVLARARRAAIAGRLDAAAQDELRAARAASRLVEALAALDPAFAGY